jgi:hypothetical protein
MSETNRHAEFDQLLFLVDETFPSRSTRSVRRHVDSCWKCRHRMEELRDTIREFGRYHEKVLSPNLPVAPREWPDLHRRMEEIDQNALPMPASTVPRKRAALGVIVFACCAAAFTLATREHPSGSAALKTSVAPAKIEHPILSAPASAVTPHASATVKLPAIDTEVLVFRVLHEVQADLGDPVDVSMVSGKVEVVTTGLATARQAEIREAVSTIPDALFIAHDAIAVPARSHGVDSVPSAAPGPFDARLQTAIPDWAGYSVRVLDESDAVLARIHALKTLNDHFPPSRRNEMRPEELDILNRLTASHRTELQDHVQKLDSLLKPVREVLQAPALSPSASRPDLLAAAQRMDRAVSVIFGGAATPEKPSQLLIDLSQASADLRSTLRGNQ